MFTTKIQIRSSNSHPFPEPQVGHRAVAQSLFSAFIVPFVCACVMCMRAQPCLTALNPVECSPLYSSVHGDRQNTGWVASCSSRICNLAGILRLLCRSPILLMMSKLRSSKVSGDPLRPPAVKHFRGPPPDTASCLYSEGFYKMRWKNPKEFFGQPIHGRKGWSFFSFLEPVN